MPAQAFSPAAPRLGQGIRLQAHGGARELEVLLAAGGVLELAGLAGVLHGLVGPVVARVPLRDHAARGALANGVGVVAVGDPAGAAVGLDLRDRRSTGGGGRQTGEPRQRRHDRSSQTPEALGLHPLRVTESLPYRRCV